MLFLGTISSCYGRKDSLIVQMFGEEEEYEHSDLYYRQAIDLGIVIKPSAILELIDNFFASIKEES